MGTKVFVLGHPVAHSKSPAMFNALYAELGLDWEYGLADRADESDARAFIDRRDFLALNVTTPYKNLAFELATHKAASAKLAGGANLLARKGEALIGYNLDGEGCVSFLEGRGVAFGDTRVVVCGTGPTSLAILHAAASAGARELVLLGRDQKRSETVLQAYVKELDKLARVVLELPAVHIGRRTPSEVYKEAEFRFGSYESSRRSLERADIIIDATPLGMQTDDPAPFDTSLLSANQVVFDVVYGHGKTALLAAAEAQSCRCFDGRGMLVAQAVAGAFIQFELNDVACKLDREEVFRLMSRAAGFRFL